MNERHLATRDDRLDGPLRDLVKFCLQTPSEDFSIGQARAMLPARAPLAELDAALQRYQASLRPLNKAEPKLDGSLTRKVADAFLPIGAKMRPDMSASAAGHWATAIVLALSDLPDWVAVQALREAVHQVYEFPIEMEKGVREIATRIVARHRSAIFRLHALRREVAEALAPTQSRVEDLREEPGPPMTLDEVRTLANGPGGMTLVRMGVTAGAIREEDVAIVRAEAASLGNQCDQGPESSIAS